MWINGSRFCGHCNRIGYLICGADAGRVFMGQEKLTKQERDWILYDVGNSAFILLVSTIIPIYFNSLASGAGLSEVDYLAFWGYAASISTIVVALIGPVLGTVADTKGFKKPLFAVSLLVGAAGYLSWLCSWRQRSGIIPA